MSTNMGTIDRRLRGFLVAPLAVVLGVVLGPASAVAIVLYLVAGVMAATAAVGFCPLYTLVHVDTRGGKPLPH